MEASGGTADCVVCGDAEACVRGIITAMDPGDVPCGDAYDSFVSASPYIPVRGEACVEPRMGSRCGGGMAEGGTCGR